MPNLNKYISDLPENTAGANLDGTELFEIQKGPGGATGSSQKLTLSNLTSKLAELLGTVFASLTQGAKADSAVQSVVAGTGATVDNTDPQNPIINVTAPLQNISVAASDETTAITTGASKVIFRNPYVGAFIVTSVKASLTSAQTSGSIFTVDVKVAGVSMFSTLLTIDNTEKTSVTATTPAVLSTTALAADDEVSVDVTQVGDGTAKGLKVYIVGHQ